MTHSEQHSESIAAPRLDFFRAFHRQIYTEGRNQLLP